MAVFRDLPDSEDRPHNADMHAWLEALQLVTVPLAMRLPRIARCWVEANAPPCGPPAALQPAYLKKVLLQIVLDCWHNAHTLRNGTAGKLVSAASVCAQIHGVRCCLTHVWLW
jgi:hypothetical protein